MSAFYRIVLSDYLQRTRSYAFLITLAISLYAAYAFVPAAGANYTTLRIGNYIGIQNSAWIGYVTAMMSSVFLSMTGFYLVNSGIKKDTDTGVGMIIATTSISNFSYLLAKALSNFMVLLSMMGGVFIMAIGLFFVRSAGYPFNIGQFVLPYLLITIPAIFFIAMLAVIGEVFLHRFTIVMNTVYFVFFCFLLSMQNNARALFDLFGFKQVTASMQDVVARTYHQTDNAISMGFIFGPKKNIQSFVFDGIDWTVSAIFSRILLIGIGILLVFVASFFFHRFDIKQRVKTKNKVKIAETLTPVKVARDIRLSALPPVITSYRIMPFIKTELLMLFRKGPKWLWLINLCGMIALIFTPISIAHQIVLPVLWFLQVGRWSDLATKEKTNRIHYFTYASYKPLSRLLPAQIMAGVILAWGLSAPLLFRYLIGAQLLPVLSILLGAVFIILCAATIGILSGGKKLFEILFFVFTYSNIEKVPFANYFGAVNHGINYMLLIGLFIIGLTLTGFLLRKREIGRM